jgi:hypothetical protein
MRIRTLIFCAIIAIALSAAPASAQNAKGWGVSAGFGIGYGTVPEGTTRDIEPALNGGVFALLPLSENWSFQPEVRFDRRTITIGEIPTDITYLSVPLLVRNRFLGIYMVQGLSINTVINASIFDVDFKEATTSPDVAIILGGGKRVGRWSFEARWETGFRALQKDLPNDLGGVRLRALTGVVSIYF